MAVLSKRRAIINLIISNLKQINGGVSSFDSAYTFTSNLSNNVYRGIKNLEAINDFPVIYAFAGPEVYKYNTVGNTEGKLVVLLRAYLNNGDRSQLKLDEDNLIQDIDHVIYKMPTTSNNIENINILLVDTSQGLLDDYSVLEIRLEVIYELESI